MISNNTFDIKLECTEILKDILNIRNLKEKVIYNGQIIEEFLLSFYYKYSEIFKVNSTLMNFDIKYNYKPQYLSMQLYGTPVLGYLLLYMNDLQTKRDFTKEKLDTLRVLNTDAFELIKFNEDNKTATALQEIKTENYLMYKV